MSVPSSFQNSSTIGPPPPRGFAPNTVRADVRPTKRYSTQRQRTTPDSSGGAPQGLYPQTRHPPPTAAQPRHPQPTTGQ